MSYPAPGDYQEAVQFPASAFRDPELQAAEPELTPLGLPRAVTGAFATVFPLAGRTQRWAVKCFLTDVPDQRTRYRAVARHLAEHDLACLIPFEYQPEGIAVQEGVYPILKMAWSAGVPLNRYVAEHLGDPDRLGRLAEAWSGMLAALEATGMAHGDLQHGNVLVRTEQGVERLVLVDYDTCYVPALKGRRSPEVGHRNYQHPDRDEHDYGPTLDHFAGLVVFTALQACRARPDLWQRFDTGENMLFRAEDFYAPDQSPLFAELLGLAETAEVAGILRDACYREPDHAPALAAVLAGEVSREHEPVRARKREGRVPSQGAGRDGWERAFLPVVIAVLVLAAAAVAAGWQVLGAGVVLAAAMGAGLWAGTRYRRHPVTRRRRRLTREMGYFGRVILRLEQEVSALERDRGDYLAGRERRAADHLRELRDAVLYDRLKHHFIGEAEAGAGVSHKVVVRLKAAGIRTVFEATPQRLGDVRSLGTESRERLEAWRRRLVERYLPELPEQMSPAEQRRFERTVQQRLAAFDAEIVRARAKARVRAAERNEVAARLSSLPPFGFIDYARYLLGLRDGPEHVVHGMRGGLHAPASLAPVEDDPGLGVPPEPPQEREGEPPWWEQWKTG